MLFVQKIEIEYRKNVRYPNYAQARNAIKFYPVKFFKKEINDEILFDTIHLYQDIDGLQYRYEKCKQFKSEKLYGGNFKRSPFGYNIAVKPVGNEYEVHFWGGFDKTVFTLKNGNYGRVVFNERRTYCDSGEWYYQLLVFNFVCCEKEKFREKIFYNKNPNYEYNGMKYLRYC